MGTPEISSVWLDSTLQNWYVVFTTVGQAQTSRHRNLSNDSDTTHYDSLQGSNWADQKDSRNEVIITSLQGQ